MHYLEEAKNLKAKADQWEFVAEYYEKFPQEYSGDSETLHKHSVKSPRHGGRLSESHV
jgi:hypothetical protein